MLDYLTLFQVLNRAGVEYLVAGGLAVNLHGVPRMTYDLDLVLLLEKQNVDKAGELLASLGYSPRNPVDFADLADPEKRAIWVRDRNMKAFTMVADAPVAEIDILLDDEDFRERLGRAEIMDLHLEGETVAVPVVSRGDLIAMKKAAGREQDLCDVRYLERGKG